MEVEGAGRLTVDQRAVPVAVWRGDHFPASTIVKTDDSPYGSVPYVRASTDVGVCYPGPIYTINLICVCGKGNKGTLIM